MKPKPSEFKCDRCSKRFPTEVGLYNHRHISNHLKKSHPIEKEQPAKVKKEKKRRSKKRGNESDDSASLFV